MADMNGKTAIVTGAASGIGRATACLFASRGANVIVSDVNASGCDETVALIQEQGGDSRAVPCDVANPDEVENLIDTSIRSFGRLDYACNNAGIEGETADTVECSVENWRKVVDVNLMGAWLCMKAEIPRMLAPRNAPDDGGGAIVNVSSIAGLIGFGGLPAYVASKHGMNGLTKTAALEYAHRGIRINSVCPGAIETPMIHRVTHHNPQEEAAMIARHPMGRMGTPKEIAELIVWLCSDAASFITGQTIAADGGYVAQ
ncbi:MAG: SDR family oxidoreductase [Phycisphaerales bacterium]|nr:MAG: SDR family oxidoreductase [Phycisphaerales bacterium]